MGLYTVTDTLNTHNTQTQDRTTHNTQNTHNTTHTTQYGQVLGSMDRDLGSRPAVRQLEDSGGRS